MDLEKLSGRKYAELLLCYTPTDAKYGQDRDVVFFPERLNINGKMKLVMIHRPVTLTNIRILTKASLLFPLRLQTNLKTLHMTNAKDTY